MPTIEDSDSDSRLALCTNCGKPQVIKRGNDDKPTLAGIQECGRCEGDEYRIVEDMTE
jgi:cytochrome c553